MKKNLLYILLIFVLAKCNLPDKPRDKKISDAGMHPDHQHSSKLTMLCQCWEITRTRNPLPKDVMQYGDVTGIYNFPGLVFLNDSIIIENPKGEIRFGKFKLTRDKIDAQFNDSSKAVYIIGILEEKYMQLMRIENNKKTILECKGDGFNYSYSKNNPYDPALNQWRIKPKVSEDSTALRLRLKQYVTFYESYFNDGINKQTQVLEFLGLPNCFVWYKGGIYIQHKKDLDQKFKNCFYNDEQAFKARQMLEDALQKKYVWVKGEDNWMKQTAPVLKQIRDSI